MKHITQWSICPDPRNPYIAPELRRPCLRGLCEGQRIVTSPLEGGEKRDGELVLRTQNTKYVLGEVDAGYEAAFPGARERVERAYTEATN